MSLRVAIDIGGTFTDLVAFDPDGAQVIREKTLTTVDAPADGVFRVLEKAGVDPSQVGMFIHGSTVAINAFLEATGANTALLTTRGFRDCYEMGRKTRPDMYNLFFEPRRCLVPRSLRFEVDERVTAGGDVLVAFDEEETRETVRRLPPSVESVAVCFVNSYAAPEHERAAAQLVRDERPDVYVSASTEVSREMREYERSSTVVMNAYVGPRVSTYLEAVEERLHAGGFVGSLLLTQSNGGIMSLSTARVQPVRMLESGPAAGVIATAQVCSELGIENAIAFDMGGTTAKACVIQGGVPEMAAEYYVGGRMTGLPVQAPFLEIVEVGAGGGSLARVDEAAGLRVGPESAGPSPGPACYGLGGNRPTITDANLLAGRIDGSRFLGGEMALDADRAAAAVGSLASDLGISLDEAVNGVIRLANSIMGHAIRAVTVERGRDPRDFALICYGGGGPVHATDLAAELEIPRVVVPAGAATFAAYGMLVADLRHDASASFVRRLDSVDPDDAEAAFAALRDEAVELLGDVAGSGEPEFQYRAELRYVGQFHTLNVPLAGPQLPIAQVAETFHAEHERRYGHSAPGEAIELTALRASAVRPIEKPAIGIARPGGAEASPVTTREILSADGNWVESAVWQREQLGPASSVVGPATIDEATTAVMLRPGDTATLTEAGHLMIELERVAA